MGKSLEERHDVLRQRVFAIANHLRIVAKIEEQNIPVRVAEFESEDARGIWRKRFEANITFLRGEASLLEAAAEEIESDGAAWVPR